MDVKALYPSLEKEHVAKIVEEETVRTTMAQEVIDWRELGMYLAVVLPRDEK